MKPSGKKLTAQLDALQIEVNRTADRNSSLDFELQKMKQERDTTKDELIVAYRQLEISNSAMQQEDLKELETFADILRMQDTKTFLQQETDGAISRLDAVAHEPVTDLVDFTYSGLHDGLCAIVNELRGLFRDSVRRTTHSTAALSSVTDKVRELFGSIKRSCRRGSTCASTILHALEEANARPPVKDAVVQTGPNKDSRGNRGDGSGTPREGQHKAAQTRITAVNYDEATDSTQTTVVTHREDETETEEGAFAPPASPPTKSLESSPTLRRLEETAKGQLSLAKQEHEAAKVISSSAKREFRAALERRSAAEALCMAAEEVLGAARGYYTGTKALMEAERLRKPQCATAETETTPVSTSDKEIQLKVDAVEEETQVNFREHRAPQPHGTIPEVSPTTTTISSTHDNSAEVAPLKEENSTASTDLHSDESPVLQKLEGTQRESSNAANASPASPSELAAQPTKKPKNKGAAEPKKPPNKKEKAKPGAATPLSTSIAPPTKSVVTADREVQASFTPSLATTAAQTEPDMQTTYTVVPRSQPSSKTSSGVLAPATDQNAPGPVLVSTQQLQLETGAGKPQVTQLSRISSVVSSTAAKQEGSSASLKKGQPPSKGQLSEQSVPQNRDEGPGPLSRARSDSSQPADSSLPPVVQDYPRPETAEVGIQVGRGWEKEQSVEGSESDHFSEEAEGDIFPIHSDSSTPTQQQLPLATSNDRPVPRASDKPSEGNVTNVLSQEVAARPLERNDNREPTKAEVSSKRALKETSNGEKEEKAVASVKAHKSSKQALNREENKGSNVAKQSRTHSQRSDQHRPVEQATREVQASVPMQEVGLQAGLTLRLQARTPAPTLAQNAQPQPPPTSLGNNPPQHDSERAEDLIVLAEASTQTSQLSMRLTAGWAVNVLPEVLASLPASVGPAAPIAATCTDAQVQTDAESYTPPEHSERAPSEFVPSRRETPGTPDRQDRKTTVDVAAKRGKQESTSTPAKRLPHASSSVASRDASALPDVHQPPSRRGSVKSLVKAQSNVGPAAAPSLPSKGSTVRPLNEKVLRTTSDHKLPAKTKGPEVTEPTSDGKDAAKSAQLSPIASNVSPQQSESTDNPEFASQLNKNIPTSLTRSCESLPSADVEEDPQTATERIIAQYEKQKELYLNEFSIREGQLQRDVDELTVMLTKAKDSEAGAQSAQYTQLQGENTDLKEDLRRATERLALAEEQLEELRRLNEGLVGKQNDNPNHWVRQQTATRAVRMEQAEIANLTTRVRFTQREADSLRMEVEMQRSRVKELEARLLRETEKDELLRIGKDRDRVEMQIHTTRLKTEMDVFRVQAKQYRLDLARSRELMEAKDKEIEHVKGSTERKLQNLQNIIATVTKERDQAKSDLEALKAARNEQTRHVEEELERVKEEKRSALAKAGRDLASERKRVQELMSRGSTIARGAQLRANSQDKANSDGGDSEVPDRQQQQQQLNDARNAEQMKLLSAKERLAQARVLRVHSVLMEAALCIKNALAFSFPVQEPVEAAFAKRYFDGGGSGERADDDAAKRINQIVLDVAAADCVLLRRVIDAIREYGAQVTQRQVHKHRSASENGQESGDEKEEEKDHPQQHKQGVSNMSFLTGDLPASAIDPVKKRMSTLAVPAMVDGSHTPIDSGQEDDGGRPRSRSRTPTPQRVRKSPDSAAHQSPVHRSESPQRKPSPTAREAAAEMRRLQALLAATPFSEYVKVKRAEGPPTVEPVVTGTHLDEIAAVLETIPSRPATTIPTLRTRGPPDMFAAPRVSKRDVVHSVTDCFPRRVGSSQGPLIGRNRKILLARNFGNTFSSSVHGLQPMEEQSRLPDA